VVPVGASPANPGFGGGGFRGQLVQVRLGPGESPVAGGARLYVGHSSPRVSAIDASSNLLLKHSDALGQGRLTFLAVSRDESKVFAAWFSAPELLVLDAFDLSVQRQVELGAGGITGLAVNPQNGRLWVATQAAESPENGVLHELDPAAEEVLRRVPLAQTASNLRFRPDGSLLYLPNRAASTLGLFDPVAGTLVGTARLPQWPSDLELSADGRRLYAVNLGSSQLLELDAQTGEQVRSFEVGTGCSAVAVHPDGKRVFVANQSLGFVQVLDLDTGQVTDMIPVGRAPQALALTADSGGLYVANAGSASVSLVDLTKMAVSDTLATGGAPSTLALVR
jgi:YVTN family beta-propeller protein